MSIFGTLGPFRLGYFSLHIEQVRGSNIRAQYPTFVSHRFWTRILSGGPYPIRKLANGGKNAVQNINTKIELGKIHIEVDSQKITEKLI
jgi:hypothetical protein